MPTGTGKTVAFTTLAARMNCQTLVVVHRDELVRQTLRTFGACWPGAVVGVVQADRNEWLGRHAVVGMVQSLRTRLHQFSPDHFGLVVVDEAHHAPADSYRMVTDHFQPHFLLGCTATPDRLDGQGLDDLFGEKPLYVYELCQAIKDGHLVRIKQYAIETQVSLDGVANRGGDFAPEALGKAVLQAGRTRAAVEALAEFAYDRKTIAFCVNLEHVEQMQEALLDSGFSAEPITGRMPMGERRRILEDYAAGRFQVLVNCEIATEGFDEPSINCVLMARPTQSRGLYQQMLGRGLRLCPATNKDDCLVLDVTDNCRTRRLMTATSLLGVEATDAEGGDVLDLLDEQQRQQQQVATVPLSAVQTTWQAEAVDPFVTAELQLLLRDYRPTQRWHNDLATDKQLKAIRDRGYVSLPPLTKGEASHILLQATSRQQHVLVSRGLWRDGMTIKEASAAIDQVAVAERWSS
jgi:superfamily II DNA or RNA helicase